MKGEIIMTTKNYKEVEAFFNERIANFRRLEKDLKVALEESHVTYNKQRMRELEEQLNVFNERIRVLEKLKQEQLNEFS